MHGTILHQETGLLEYYQVKDIIATTVKEVFAPTMTLDIDLGTLKLFTAEKT
jgi:hypothetical protein